MPSYRLYKALKPALGKGLSFMATSSAYREARRFFEDKQRELPELSEYARIIVKPYLKKWLREGLYWDAFATTLALAGVNLMEAKYIEQFERVLGPAPQPAASMGIDEILARFHVDQHHTGESFDNLLKVFYLAERYPNLTLFVQTNPAFCCPSLVTEAMSREIERATGVPVVTVTYDGTVSNKNEVVIPYLQLAREKGAFERCQQSYG